MPLSTKSFTETTPLSPSTCDALRSYVYLRTTLVSRCVPSSAMYRGRAANSRTVRCIAPTPLARTVAKTSLLFSGCDGICERLRRTCRHIHLQLPAAAVCSSSLPRMHMPSSCFGCGIARARWRATVGASLRRGAHEPAVEASLRTARDAQQAACTLLAVRRKYPDSTGGGGQPIDSRDQELFADF